MITYTEQINTRFLKEFRHPSHNGLLCRAAGKGHIEVKDKKTRAVVYTGPSREHNDIGVKGPEFQKYAINISCPSCNRLLCRALGPKLFLEIKCTHCKEVHTYKLSKLYDIKYKALPGIARERIYLSIKDLTF